MFPWGIAVVLLALSGRAVAQEKPAGVLEVKITPPEGGDPSKATIEVLNLQDDFAVAEGLNHDLTFGDLRLGRFDHPAKVRPSAEKVEGASHRITVPPGRYHVRVRLGDQECYREAPEVKEGATAAVDAAFETPGSIKGSWKLDKGALDFDGKPGKVEGGSADIGLVWNGIVVANTKADMGKEFLFERVPPGEYSVVLSSVGNWFDWVCPGVKVDAGKASSVTADVKRSQLGGILFQLKEGKSSKNMGVGSGGTFLLMDDKRRFAVVSNIGYSDGDNDQSGFGHIPTASGYVLLVRSEGFKDLVKKGVKVSAPKVKPPDPKGLSTKPKIEYPVQSVPLDPKNP